MQNHAQGHLRANNQARRTQNILKFVEYHYNEDSIGNSKSISLISQSFNLFDYIPKNFQIITPNGSYSFNDEMLKDTSSVISEYLTNNPNSREFKIDIKDDENIMSKVEKMYNGRIVSFKENELIVLQKIVTTLNIIRCPQFMKLKSYEIQDLPTLFQLPNYMVKIDMAQFIIFLRKTFPKSFTISTNNHEYKCNKIGIQSSIIIKEQLEKDPNLNSYHFDFDDEFDIFQNICNLFNFHSIEINTDNMHAIKKIADDLQINCIISKVINIIESYETAVQTIDKKYSLIDSVVELCNNLYCIQKFGVEKVQEKILMSIWPSTKENVQELACYLIQVINNDFSLHPYIMDLITLLDKNSKEDENELKILIPYFLKQMLLLFPYNKNNCAFIFRLIKKGLILIDDVIKKLNSFIKDYEARKNSGYYKISNKDQFISHLTAPFETRSNIDFTKLKNAVVWFFPEMLSNKDVNSILEDDQLKKFIQFYIPDKIENFKEMRESGQPDNEAAKAIINDDVDCLQKIMNNHPSIENNIPYNLFSEDENISFINYAASNGSIKCFKYLLLNHSEIDKASLYYAIAGKNIEIVRIIDQYYCSKGIKIDYSFDSNDFCNKINGNSNSNNKKVILAPIIPAIIKHQNDIFDWILESKYKSEGITGNDLFDIASLAVQNGNAHAFIQCIDKGFDLSSLPIKKISKIIEQSASNGFCRLTQLIISLLSTEEFDDENFCDLFEFEDSVFCGNLSLVKSYFATDVAYYDIGKGLCTAIERGYLQVIQILFETDCIKKIRLDQSSIIKAFVKTFQKQQTEIFDYLFEETNLIDILTPNSLLTLLSYSCHIGNLKSTQLLTEFVLNKNIKSDFSKPFLHAACSDHDKICQYFYDRKVLINYIDLFKQKSVLACCSKAIFEIIFNSADPEVKEAFLCHFLNESIKNQNSEVVDFLLQKELPHDDTLFEAVSAKNVEIVNIVLKYNSKPSFINQLFNDGTALNKAVDLNEYDIVKRLLLIPGINPNLYGNNLKTPLISAVSNFNLDIFNLLLDYFGENIESQKWQLDEALKAFLRIISGEEHTSNIYFQKIEAIFIGSDFTPENQAKKRKELILKFLKRFIQIKNINLNCSSKKYTLLSYACEANEIEIVSILIKSDQVDVNSYLPAKGKTPLMISIENKNVEIAKLLINLPKTNINARNYNRKTALTIAVEKNLGEIVDLIVNNEKFDPYESLLDSAFAFSEGQISKQLFSLKSLDVNYKFVDKDNECHRYDNWNEDGLGIMKIDFIDQTNICTYETSLIHAVIRNDQNKVDLIINHPSFDPVKSQVKSALFLSVSKNNIKIFRLLLSILDNNVNILSQTQESLFSYSIRYGSEEIIEEIIKNKNFDPDKADIADAFVKAYSVGEKKEKKKDPSHDFMIFANVDLFKQNKEEEIAPIKLMKLLIKFDEDHKHLIDFSRLLPDGKSFFTTMNPDLANNGEVAAFLLEQGVDPDEPDDFGEYPLKFFIENNLVDAAVALINSGLVYLDRRFAITINQYFGTIYDISYLHLAASLPTSDVLSAILDYDIVDINCEDSSGKTPLIKAVYSKSINNIKLLFSCEDLNYQYCYDGDFDIIDIAKSFVDYKSHDKVQLESKDDYLDYLIHILSYQTYY